MFIQGLLTRKPLGAAHGEAFLKIILGLKARSFNAATQDATSSFEHNIQ
jgi:hypothetical protein